MEMAQRPLNGLVTQVLSAQYSGFTLVCDGIAWYGDLNNGTSGGGGGSCPGGFTSVNAEYCIETNENVGSPGTFWVASDASYAAGARLCSWSEWYMACNNTGGLSNMTNDKEWIDAEGLASTSARRAGASCTNCESWNVGTSSTFRCCYTK